jgi:hypothetical protein
MSSDRMIPSGGVWAQSGPDTQLPAIPICRIPVGRILNKDLTHRSEELSAIQDPQTPTIRVRVRDFPLTRQTPPSEATPHHTSSPQHTT